MIMKHQTYNKKAFLLPESANSMSAYHAKIDCDGIMKLTISDCNGIIRLWNDLKTDEGIQESVEKLETLGSAIIELQDFIYQNYIQKK